MDLYPVSEENRQLLEELRELMKNAPPEDQKLLQAEKNVVQLQEDDLLRYIKARKFVVADAYEQLIETLRWRDTAYGVGLDKLYAEGVPDENEEFFQLNCPHCYRGFDKEGRPISWERTGVFHLPDLLAGVGEEGLLKRRVYHQELMARKMREKSKELGRPVTQQVWVLDARNLSLKPSGDGPKMFKETIKIDSTYYPERLGYMYIINAPWIFKPLWAMIRPWLDQNTVAKIRIFGYSDYQEELKKVIDEDNIPIEYGGSAIWRLPGRPMDWSDVEDDECENGYHEITLKMNKGEHPKEGGAVEGGGNKRLSRKERKAAAKEEEGGGGGWFW